MCARHPNVAPWKSGFVCRDCEIDPPPPLEGEKKSAAPVVPDLPTVVDHERAQLRRALACESAAEKLMDLGDEQLASCNEKLREAREANGKVAAKKARESDDALGRAISAFNCAAKLDAEATKKRRAATEGARWREDWQRTEQLEDELRRMREGQAH